MGVLAFCELGRSLIALGRVGRAQPGVLSCCLAPLHPRALRPPAWEWRPRPAGRGAARRPPRPGRVSAGAS
eukprot:5693564-Alexandrium_andersonii.AAC.1